jgi:uncharacterized protein (TIGR02147 family)
MQSLFEYMNYRDFLHDFYQEKKQRHAFYSFRLFSEKAGFKSPNFLKLVIEGARNLSKDSVFKFCKGLGFNRKEADYFENLVFFNQSKSLEEKNSYLANLMKYRKQSDPTRIEQSAFSYFSQWYHPVIRELATAIDFRDDFKKLGQTVAPAISPLEAQKSVELLIELGFIEKTSAGVYRKTAATLTTGHQVRSVAIANYHKAMMRLAAESIERFPAAGRDIESVTVSVSSATYQSIMGKAHEFLLELLKLAEADTTAEQVAQINLQVFPLARPIAPKGDQA